MRSHQLVADAGDAHGRELRGHRDRLELDALGPAQVRALGALRRAEAHARPGRRTRRRRRSPGDTGSARRWRARAGRCGAGCSASAPCSRRRGRRGARAGARSAALRPVRASAVVCARTPVRAAALDDDALDAARAVDARAERERPRHVAHVHPLLGARWGSRSRSGPSRGSRARSGASCARAGPRRRLVEEEAVVLAEHVVVPPRAR